MMHKTHLDRPGTNRPAMCAGLLVQAARPSGRSYSWGWDREPKAWAVTACKWHLSS